MERIKTGIYGLDQLIEGGVRDNSAIVVVGSSGTGKTTFVMQFLMQGIENGEQGLYVTNWGICSSIIFLKFFPLRWMKNSDFS